MDDLSKPLTSDKSNTGGMTQNKHHKRFVFVSIQFVLALSLLSVVAIHELSNSHLQARLLSSFATKASYVIEKGSASDQQIHYPTAGPFDERLGYIAIPDFLESLQTRNYTIDAQARWSAALQQTVQWGLFPPYHEKTRTGLSIHDHQNNLLYQSKYPKYSYEQFEDIPSLVLETLLYIENRELLDKKHPKRNPAIEWDRMAKVISDMVINLITQDEEKLAGGSTLATQIEKYRHSPDGLTSSAVEKLRQMASASLRIYLDGELTLATRKRIALDYINTVPLAARLGYGEVNGIGDGLRVWFGSNFQESNHILQRTANKNPAELQEQARVFKQVLSLFLAQRRPSYYLNNPAETLDKLASVYLKLLLQAKIISPELHQAAEQYPLRFSSLPIERSDAPFADNKAVNVTRSRLTTMLNLNSLYDLDRIDLSVGTSFDLPLQHIATSMLQSMASPDAAKEAGLFGERLLNPKNDLSKIIYSFTLMERTPTANLVRIQADNFDQPLDINEGVKLDLGSTAKLRTLVTYLNIIADLHNEYSKLPTTELRTITVEGNNVLSRWAIDYLIANPGHNLDLMLSAAMQRSYSANPGERFFTGGGIHTFSNFDNKDNGRIVTVNEALQDSLNLPFVRLMRDIVRYHTYRVPGSTARLLEDIHDERRTGYLSRFAEREGGDFVQRFYRKYKGKSSTEIIDLLLSSTRLTPTRLAMIYNSTTAHQSLEQFTNLLEKHLPLNTLSEKAIKKLLEQYTPDNYSLPDQGYIARLHPLEIWTVAFLIKNSHASAAETLAASVQERQEVYNWLRKTRHKNAQDNRIRHLLETEAFLEIHKDWKRLGYPFESLIPSYASAIGSSADRPAALAELMGILLNDGVRLPIIRITHLRLAEDTPYEAQLSRIQEQGKQVIRPEVAVTVRKALINVVENGTAKRLHQTFSKLSGNSIAIGGKTGTGDHRLDVYGRGGQLLKSKVMNRTATFVFFIGDRYFGTLTAFVPGSDAANYRFTSGLPVQLLKALAPQLYPNLSFLPVNESSITNTSQKTSLQNNSPKQTL